MEQDDWTNLASAYETWCEHTNLVSIVDQDLKEYVKSVFSSYNLWDEANDSPNLEGYRNLIYSRC